MIGYILNTYINHSKVYNLDSRNVFVRQNQTRSESKWTEAHAVDPQDSWLCWRESHACGCKCYMSITRHFDNSNVSLWLLHLLFLWLLFLFVYVVVILLLCLAYLNRAEYLNKTQNKKKLRCNNNN